MTSPSLNRRLALSGLLAFATLALAPAGASGAQPLDRPAGKVVLTISGAIGTTNGEGQARFDMAMLAALPTVTIKTTTIWTEGEQSFTGVRLADLLAAVGAEGGTLAATAVNDYAVEIPVEDWGDIGPIVAYLRNGAPMTLREKGPLWIVYPYDSDAAYRTEVVYSRSIWQLDRLEVQR